MVLVSRRHWWRKSAAVLFLLAAVAASLWWSLFALRPYALEPQALQQRYATATLDPQALRMQIEAVPEGPAPRHAFDLRYRSFDGSEVIGRIAYPSDPAAATRPFPVVVALHGLGRTHQRWWQDALRGRPTIESTHRVAGLALQRGVAVVAIDARRHGAREPGFAASSLLTDLHLWGRRAPYEAMIIDTVRDHRVLLDWLQRQPHLDAARIGAVGYSMGAQAALLLAGTDPRIRAVAAMVPPNVDDRVAAVSPLNVAPRLGAVRVWLLTADEDDHASVDDNAALFAALPGLDKRHLRFAGGHALPAAYVERLAPWFDALAR